MQISKYLTVYSHAVSQVCSYPDVSENLHVRHPPILITADNLVPFSNTSGLLAKCIVPYAENNSEPFTQMSSPKVNTFHSDKYTHTHSFLPTLPLTNKHSPASPPPPPPDVRVHSKLCLAFDLSHGWYSCLLPCSQHPHMGCKENYSLFSPHNKSVWAQRAAAFT